jgi:hypothetical protein
MLTAVQLLDGRDCWAPLALAPRRRKCRPPCRHCGRPACRPRGLCWACYHKPGVRDLYPSASKFARRGSGLGSGRAPLPDAPTSALPGTEAKVLVLIERARKRQSLWHPDDAPMDGESRRLGVG